MIDPHTPRPFSVTTTQARKKISAIVTHVQHPDAFVVLTRNGREEAAVVSMANLRRIWSREEIDDIIAGRKRPARFTFGVGFGLGIRTNREAAEAIQRIQLDRRTEREVLKQAGLQEVPGGELRADPVVRVEGVWARVRRWVRRRVR